LPEEESLLLIQLALASGMVVVCVLVHLVGLTMTLRLLRIGHRGLRRPEAMPAPVLLGASLGVFGVHTIEIWLYALLYRAVGLFQHFEEALYFSTVTYATIGYGDLTLSHDWRVLGAIEGATGVIMLGWSTAFLVSLLTRLRLLGHDWLTPPSRKSSHTET
jgi:hypothetical protein